MKEEDSALSEKLSKEKNEIRRISDEVSCSFTDHSYPLIRIVLHGSESLVYVLCSLPWPITRLLHFGWIP